ncbi:hypothetical protein DFR24_4749 [Panacagrimonas perspica]|uniref:DUF2946 family protein n=1 Tax=Panacagrimonas perspica TaxID=381431 RepID=A0A4V3F3Y4_9GAMM|nr:hypothetical protein [Panacagrimonas perspica]TDU23226.1 hypothetical protein DFR24_4749 [Panacagrimonas perspica]THD01371.1 hypothetical protein B1810_19685 [Panacagrimonas perspica]
MSRRVLTPWVLIASLLFGLWMAASHDPNHAGTVKHPDACAICAFAGSAGGGLVSVVAALVLAAIVCFFAPLAVPPARVARRSPIRVRGPPAVLA